MTSQDSLIPSPPERSELEARVERALKIAREAAAQTKVLGAKVRPVSALLAARMNFIKIISALDTGRTS